MFCALQNYVVTPLCYMNVGKPWGYIMQSCGFKGGSNNITVFGAIMLNIQF